MKLWTLLSAKQFEQFDRGRDVIFEKPSHIFNQTQDWLLSSMALESWPIMTFFKTPSAQAIQSFISDKPVVTGSLCTKMNDIYDNETGYNHDTKTNNIHVLNDTFKHDINQIQSDIKIEKKFSASLYPSNDEYFNEMNSCSVAINAMKPHQGVIVELNVPNNEKMMFFYEKAWDYIFNYRFLGTEQEIKDFTNKCIQKGFAYPDLKPEHHDELHQDIINSWKRIFDMKWCEKYMSKISEITKLKQFQGIGQKFIKPFKSEEQYIVLLSHINPMWMDGCYYINQNLLDSLGIDNEKKVFDNKPNKIAI